MIGWNGACGLAILPPGMPQHERTTLRRSPVLAPLSGYPQGGTNERRNPIGGREPPGPVSSILGLTRRPDRARELDRPDRAVLGERSFGPEEGRRVAARHPDTAVGRLLADERGHGAGDAADLDVDFHP